MNISCICVWLSLRSTALILLFFLDSYIPFLVRFFFGLFGWLGFFWKQLVHDNKYSVSTECLSIVFFKQWMEKNHLLWVWNKTEI